MFCTKCGARIDDGAGFCSECGSPVSSFAGGRPGTVPLEGRDTQKAKVPLGKGSEKWLWILLGVLIAAILAVGIILVAARPWADRDRDDGEISADGDAEDTRTEEELEEPEPEEEEASPKAADVLQNFLDGELAGQYGYADLGAETVSFPQEWDETNTRMKEIDGWTGVSGIGDARILDLDGDGQEELLVILLEEESIRLCVYEAEGDVPVKKSEFLERRSSDIFSHEDVVMLVDGGDASYLLFLQAYWGGIYSDGYYAQAGLYRYNGESLYAPLTIQQDGEGSSDFVYIARQYDGGTGAPLSEEVILDEAGYHGAALGEEDCRRRMKELFGSYGVGVGDQATMQIYGGNFDGFLAPGENSQVLMRLQVQAEWGKIQRNANTEMKQEAAFHFNPYRAPFKITGWEDDEAGYLFDGTKLFCSVGGGPETELLLDHPGTVQKVEYMDITGDGIEEAVVHYYMYSSATEYEVMDFIKMESGRVTDISPWRDMPELADDWWNMEVAEPFREGYTSPILKLSSYKKEDGMASVDRELLVGYKDGRWQEVQ